MLSFNEVFDSLKEDLVLGKEVKFFPNGRSMFPTIVEKRDYVYLSKTSFKVLDIIFYKVEDKYLLHRVVKIDGDKIICQGDNNLVKEVITRDDVIGVVVKLYRKNKEVKRGGIRFKSLYLTSRIRLLLKRIKRKLWK